MCRKMGMVTKSSSFGWTCSQHSIAKREPEEKRYLNYMCWSADRKYLIPLPSPFGLQYLGGSEAFISLQQYCVFLQCLTGLL
ncbi:uncharacterized protein LOC144543822 isoform X6 [Carex rostrata]